MIVGTAGHIDHGKSTLVAALTGMSGDRLPEERARGMSIELGYAWLDSPDADPDRRIGFIDVPGHERLVHTMLAGAGGIDFALLLVAADDGAMPQTREHLAVLSLLGIDRGAAVITKTDRVDADRVAAVQAEVHALLARSTLAAAPVLPVSARSGDGVDALRALLFEAARAPAGRFVGETGFRLAVDRVFVLDGVGTVATGTVHGGQVAVGDSLALVPSEDRLEGRVRGLQIHGRRVDRAGAGQRCAISLAALSKGQIERGQWLTAPAIAQASDRIDVLIHLWHEESRPLRSGTRVHLHLGAAATIGSVVILDAIGGGDALAPGASARAQLVLREPIGAWHGDRVVLRDASASRTLAGGVVLDVFAPARYRRTPQRLTELEACVLATPGERLAGLLAAAPFGVELRRWARGQGMPADAIPSLPAGCVRAHDASGEWALGAVHAQALRDAVLSRLRSYHEGQPDELGPEAGRLRRLSAPRLPDNLWRALLADLESRGEIARRGPYAHLPEHGVRLSASEQRIAEKVAPLLAQAGREGAWARDLARGAREPEALMRTTLARLARRGELHQVVKDLYYAQQTMNDCANIVREIAARENGAVTVAGFRDASGLGRKRATQILEYLDRIGMLRRLGDVHKVRADSMLFTL